METKIESILSSNLLTEMETLEIHGGADINRGTNTNCLEAKCSDKCTVIDNPKTGEKCGGGETNVNCNGAIC